MPSKAGGVLDGGSIGEKTIGCAGGWAGGTGDKITRGAAAVGAGDKMMGGTASGAVGVKITVLFLLPAGERRIGCPAVSAGGTSISRVP